MQLVGFNGIINIINQYIINIINQSSYGIGKTDF